MTNVLGAILKQPLERDGITESVWQALHHGITGYGGRAVRILDLVEMLNTTITSLAEGLICIDGLDECHLENR